MEIEVSDKLQENIFGLEEVEFRGYQLESFTSSHYELVIKVFKPANQTVYLLFGATQFFSGVVAWNGTNIRLHPTHECLELLDKHRPRLAAIFHNVELIDSFPYKLFSSITEDGTLIQIVAAGAELISAKDF